MDELQTRYAKWEKPDAEDHMLYNSIDMKYLEKASL